VPYAPARPCSQPGCPHLTRRGRRCPEHARVYERARGSAAARGYGPRWQAASAAYLAANPRCVCGPGCCPNGCGRPATDVHHLDGLGPLGPRGYDPSNWAALHRTCHARVTVREQGGFGRPREL
jgi:5-methylcytosine-specific restriction protein A